MGKKLLLSILCAFFCLTVCSQEEDGLSRHQENIWDIDSIFDKSPVDITEDEDNTPINLRDKITLEAVYGFIAGFAPGWSETPWYHDEERKYDYILGARMEALLSMNFPLTDSLRVHNAFHFSLPGYDSFFSIKEFYFDYDLWGKAFLKAGLYEIAWGISRFYPFTNLPAIVPKNNNSSGPGDSYIVRLTIPRGIGGLELLAMTRWGYMDKKQFPQFNEFAYGIKYNLAMEAADIDTGFLYYKDLPFRYFVSVKTTLGNTELYTEGIAAIYKESWEKPRFSGNIGFLRDFFNGKLTLTGEVYYNGEHDVAWWRSKTDLLDESMVDLFPGLNGALAFIIRPGIIGMRIFAQALYTYEGESVWLVPGISVRPGGINITVSVPIALGTRREDGSNYYRNNTDERNRPFSIILGVNFSGKLRFTL